MGCSKAFFIFYIALLLLSSITIASAENAIIANSTETIPLNATKLFSGITLTDATWDFADDTTGTGLNVNHTYTYDGVYRVTVTATDNKGKAL